MLVENDPRITKQQNVTIQCLINKTSLLDLGSLKVSKQGILLTIQYAAVIGSR